MGKKSKKTKWRTLELPALPTIISEKTTKKKWDTGVRITSSGSSFSFKQQQQQQQLSDGKISRHHSSMISAEAMMANAGNTFFARANGTGDDIGPVHASNHTNEKATAAVIEDGYTKITTPRQDVLFKKGYLSKRKTTQEISYEPPPTTFNHFIDGGGGVVTFEVCCLNNEEIIEYRDQEEEEEGEGGGGGGGGEEEDEDDDDADADAADGGGGGGGGNGAGCCGGDGLQPSSLTCSISQSSYVETSSVMYYGSGGFELYDPYTGSVAIVVGSPADQYHSSSASCQPILTSVPCAPVPLQTVQWFNPLPSAAAAEWCSYSSLPVDEKNYSLDSQNGGILTANSERSPVSPRTEAAAVAVVVDEQQNTSPPSPYSTYPGYVFGAPVYNLDGT